MRRLIVTAIVALGSGCDGPPVAPADRVFLSGAVYTLDEGRPWARAVAIRDGEIVYVGDDAAAREHVGEGTVVSDLAGGMLLPGFHDSHCHLYSGAFLEATCNLTGLADEGDMRVRLEECARSPARGSQGWLLGGGWDLLTFPDGGPDKALLDAVVPGRPVYLHSVFGHSAWVSSEALRRAGIDADTPDPSQGRIERDPVTGEPSGVLRDAAMTLVERVIPEASLEERVAWLRGGIERAHGFGITSLIEPGADASMLEPYVALSRRGELTLRVLVSLSPRAWHPGALGPEVFDLVARRQEFRGPNLAVDSVKLYMDGVVETGSGALLEPYAGRGDFRGHPFHSQEQVDEFVRRFDAEGIQVHVHAVGDRGVRMALDAFEGARRTNGETGARHHIVHLQVIDPADIPRFAALGVIANFQALWAWPDPWAMELGVAALGEERGRRQYAIGSVVRAGGTLVAGSDWFVSSLDPLDAIEVAVRRQDPDRVGGPVLNAAERVDLATILRAYTLGGAYLMGQEDVVGSIEVGKRADLVVVDRNLFEIPPEQINEARVLATLSDGREVFTAPPAAASGAAQLAGP
jgi:predicted amidohydrolase YtcJ